MNRTWPLAVALILSACTGDRSDSADALPEPGVEATSASVTTDPEAVPTPEPVADQATDVEPSPVAQIDLDELFAEFVESPDGETFLTLRSQIIASDAYQPYSDEFTSAEELLDIYKLDEARAALQDTMPNLLLSPRAHRLLAEINSAAADVPAADRERLIAAACVEGILATGDGSEQQPWLVLRTSDEYDVLAELGKRAESQSLVERDGKHFDLIECTDDSEVWFDVTDAFEQLGKSLGQ